MMKGWIGFVLIVLAIFVLWSLSGEEASEASRREGRVERPHPTPDQGGVVQPKPFPVSRSKKMIRSLGEGTEPRSEATRQVIQGSRESESVDGTEEMDEEEREAIAGDEEGNVGPVASPGGLIGGANVEWIPPRPKKPDDKFGPPPD